MIKRLLVFTLAVALAGTAHAVTWTWTGGAETTDWYGVGNWSAGGGVYTNNPTEQYVGLAGTAPASPPHFMYLNADVTASNISGATVGKTVDDQTTFLTSNSLVMGGSSPVMTLSDAATLNIGANLWVADDTAGVGGVTARLRAGAHSNHDRRPRAPRRRGFPLDQGEGRSAHPPQEGAQLARREPHDAVGVRLNDKIRQGAPPLRQHKAHGVPSAPATGRGSAG